MVVDDKNVPWLFVATLNWVCKKESIRKTYSSVFLANLPFSLSIDGSELSLLYSTEGALVFA